MPSSPQSKNLSDVSTPVANSNTSVPRSIRKARDGLDTQEASHITTSLVSTARGTLEPPFTSENTTRSNPRTDAMASTPTQPSPKIQSPYASKPLLHVFESPISETSEMPAIAAGNSMNPARTSRVIEHLGKELDRHKREISLLTAKLDEEQRRSESSQVSLESARASAAHYESMYDQGRQMVARKSRKLNDVTLELEGERSRRIQAEKERNESLDLVTKIFAQTQKELNKEKELARFANAQYETLRGSMKGEEKLLRTKISDLRLEFNDLKQQRETDYLNLQKLETVSQERCKQNAAMDMAHQGLVSHYDLYRTERDRSIQQFVDKAQQIQKTGESLATEMEHVLGTMKYIINVKETLRG